MEELSYVQSDSKFTIFSYSDLSLFIYFLKISGTYLLAKGTPPKRCAQKGKLLPYISLMVAASTAVRRYNYIALMVYWALVNMCTNYEW